MKNKVEYNLHVPNYTERTLRNYLLLENINYQKWYYILELKFWRGPGLVCIQ